MTFRRFARLAPLAAVLTAGCFATRNDVRLLQQDIARLQVVLASQRAEDERAAARRDSIQAAEVREIAQTLSITDDSLRSLIRQFGGFRTTVSEEVYAMREQLIQVYARLGASTQQIAQLQQQMESARMREQQAAAATGDSGAVRDTGGAAVTEGPVTLFSRATSLLQRGSTGTARRTFEELLAQYPDSDLAPRSLLYIAEAFQTEDDHGAADSVLALVVERYPRSPEAPTALYKRAGALEKAGQTQRALQLYDRVVNDYPQSDVVTLAREAAARLRRE